MPHALKAGKVSIFKIVDKCIKFYSQNTNLLPSDLNLLFNIYVEVSKNFIKKSVVLLYTLGVSGCHNTLFMTSPY